MRRSPLLVFALVALLLGACSTPPVANLTPVIDAVTPASGPYATSVSITGKGFAADSQVHVCGAALADIRVELVEVPVVAGPNVGGAPGAASKLTGRLAGLAPYGPCDVIVTSPNGERTVLEDGFEHVRVATPTSALVVRVLTGGVPAEGAAVTARSSGGSVALLGDPGILAMSDVAPRSEAEVDCGVTDGGGYATCDLPQGEWDIFASHGGRKGMVGGAIMTARGGDGGDISLDETGSVTVTVEGEEGAAAGSLVTLGSVASGTTGEGGTLVLADIPAGTYEMRVEYEAHLPATRTVEVRPGVDRAVAVELVHVQRAPLYISTPVKAAVEDAAYSYQLHAVDPDGDALSFSGSSLPGWLALTDNGDGTARLAGTPGNEHVGNQLVDVAVSDGTAATSQSFAIAVSNVNDRPVITSVAVTAATEDVPYSYAFSASDVDVGDALSITSSELPAWLSFLAGGDGTAVLSGTPGNDDVGSIDLTITVSDGEAEVSQDFTLTVDDVNDAPRFTSVPLESSAQDSAYSYAVTAADDEGGALVVTATVLPSWLNLVVDGAGAAILSGTPSNDDVGSHDVTLRVSDGAASTDQRFTITVADVNDAPVIASAAVTSAVEDAAYAYSFSAKDVDLGDVLTVSAPVLPAWLTLVDNGDGTADLTGTPSNDDVGSHAVTLRVTDGAEADEQVFTVAVTNVNDAPVINSVATTAAAEDAAYSYAFSAYDVDAGDTLVITSTGLPAWLSLVDAGDGTATLSGTPGDYDVGGFDLTIIVSDGQTSVAQAFTLTVADVNDAPVITSAAIHWATAGQAYGYTFSASDVDARDVLTVTAPVLPAWLSLTDHGDGTATLAGTPANGDAGDHPVSLRVSDATTTVEQEFVVTVAGNDHPPVIHSFTAPSPVWVDVEATFGFSASDEDGDVLSCALDAGDGTGRRALGSCGQVTHTYSATGIFQATIFVMAGGVEETAAVTVDLQPAVFPAYCDDCGIEVPFHPQFTFSFYGDVYSNAYVNSNGLITFGGATTAYGYSGVGTDGDIPNLPSIAVFWSDLEVTSEQQVQYEAHADRLVITYDRIVHLYDGTQEFSAVATLHQDGRIEVAYGALGDAAGDAYLIGVFDGSGTGYTYLTDASSSSYDYLTHGGGAILYAGAIFDYSEEASISSFSHRTITYRP